MPGRKRQQHVEQRRVGARIGVHREEAPQHTWTCFARARRGLQRRLDLRFGLAVRRGHFLRRAVGAGDELEHVGLGFLRVRGDLGAQVFLGVIQRVLDERGVLAGKRRAQLLQVVLNGSRSGGS